MAQKKEPTTTKGQARKILNGDGRRKKSKGTEKY
jgi:hypothetical protein